MKTYLKSLSLVAIFLLSGCTERSLPASQMDGGGLDGTPQEDVLPADKGQKLDLPLLKKDVARGDVLKLDIEKADTMPQDTAPPPPCPHPSHPEDCSQVTNFQCGFGVHCEGNTIVAIWHEHVFCSGQPMEEIVDYSCRHECPAGCIENGSWALDGAELVAQHCTIGGDPGPADAGVGQD